eukprot:TRINITY_DN6345_c0_g1_i4.p1 TRINITY_DN6345_c0_g1~~TRINITY_DN6345_c0_g1_i4.p1  ORF type:complete len:1476 (-),score=436.33 TRINITY_DN6345_c0_g1_i4:120-4547(-)
MLPPSDRAQAAELPEQSLVMRNIVRENKPPRRIHHIQFAMMDADEMAKVSTLQVVTNMMYSPGSVQTPFGVLDQRLGTSQKNGVCQTCNEKIEFCVGHFGFLRLELPVFHIGFFKATMTLLQCICKTCARLLIPEEAILSGLQKRRRSPGPETLTKKAMAKAVIDKCKRCRQCPHCSAFNGSVKKARPLKMFHERFTKRTQTNAEDFYKRCAGAMEFNEAVGQHLNKVQEDINPSTVLELFKRMPDDDCVLLDFDPAVGRPEKMLLETLLVPPVCIRPSVHSEADSTSNEDDLTVMLADIIHVNNIIRDYLLRGYPDVSVMDDWEYMQTQVALYINTEANTGALPNPQNKGPQRGLCQRLKGKTGRFRGNLSGKRVDFSGRTVISPDPNIGVNELCVPKHMAKVLTYPAKANMYNIDQLRQCVINGTDVHPGANYILKKNGRRKFLKYVSDRVSEARQLQEGETVERHLSDGDIVLFNRQPSLHKLSIMAHRARIMPWRTLRFNECVCAPYNADFDGDEMNMHVPQTEEARAEAIELMGTVNNLVTPRNGELVISPTQDFLTAAYLLTSKDRFYDRASFCQLICFMSDACEQIDLPPPAIMKPVELWTGKQLWAVLIRSKHESPIFVSFSLKNKSWHPDWKGDPWMEPNDGYICFQNSELMCGVLDKKVMGGGKNSLFYVLLRQYGSAVAGACMLRVSKLSARFMGQQGFSIGINDVTASSNLVTEKAKMIDTGFGEVTTLIESYEAGELESLPGMNLEKSLESKIQGVLSNIRNLAGKLCIKELPLNNAPRIMERAGSKGSEINIAQMVTCVGQQVVSGSRIPHGFVNRTLPHFAMFERTPEAKGFVQNSFYSGLKPTEFFFHTMGGREGLVDTAVKTAETGYMQRRLMKAMEDLSIQWDNTCRTSAGDIIQFVYGEDGLDPTDLDDQNEGLNFERQLEHTLHTTPCWDEAALLPAEIRKQLLKHKKKHIGVKAAELEEAKKSEAEACIKQAKKEMEAAQSAGDPSGIAAAVAKLTAAETKLEEQTKVEPKWLNMSIKCLESFILKLDSSIKQADECVKKFDKKKQAKPARERAIERFRLTKTQIASFLEACQQRISLAVVEPGTACGALAGQSIGEPGTQMTLKTFHFAGVASMNVTMGVPRIKEIINAAKTVSTPIVDVSLCDPFNLQSASIVKGRIECTRLKQVAVYIKEVHDVSGSFVSIKLDLLTISKLQLEITIENVQHAIVAQSKRKIALKDVKVRSNSKIHVNCLANNRQDMLIKLQLVQKLVPQVQVAGIPGIERAVISCDEKTKKHKVYVEGYGMENVYGIAGVDGTRTYSNHIAEIQACLGIEAARIQIVTEINKIFHSYSIGIDIRHIWLLADTMTYRGEVLGITRFGIEKMRDSVLMLASFEKTADHLFEAAVRSRVDDVSGVSECIIMGIPVPVGTGNLKLIHNNALQPLAKTQPGHEAKPVVKKAITKKQTLLSRSYAN